MHQAEWGVRTLFALIKDMKLHWHRQCGFGEQRELAPVFILFVAVALTVHEI